MSHSTLRAQYTLDEEVHPTGKAWEWWEFKIDGFNWEDFETHPKWLPHYDYRRKPDAPKMFKRRDGTLAVKNQGEFMNHDHLKDQYALDEQVHPLGKAWEWWEVQKFVRNYDEWQTLSKPPSWYLANKYRRKADAPLVYNDHGVTRCVYGDKPQAAIDACKDMLEINDQPKWTGKLTDSDEEAQLLEDIADLGCSHESDMTLTDYINQKRREHNLVNHPYHYAGQGKIECIEVLEQLAADGHDFRVLNAMKYLWRYRHKGGTESLRKAIWYIERMIEDLS